MAAVLVVYILVGVLATYYFLKAPKDWKEVAQARQEAVDVGTGAGNSTTEKGDIRDDAEATADETFDAEDSKPNKGKKKGKNDQNDGKKRKGKGKKGKGKKSKGQGAKDFDNPVSNFDDEKGD